MYCPYCGSAMPEHSNQCNACGAVSYISNRRRSVPWRILIPVVLLTAAFVLGIGLFFLIPALETPNTITTGNYFELHNGVLYFNEDAYTGGRVLVVPDAINGQPVTAIGENCFYDCDNLTTIVLPNAITSIGSNAFAQCDNLRGMDIPEKVTQIGEGAFHNCPAFGAVYIPPTVTSIGPNTFDGCHALRFIFYRGNFEQWDALYREYINPFTTAVCLDGYYYHGAN